MTIPAAAFTAETTESGRIVAWNNGTNQVVAVAIPDTYSGRWIIRRAGDTDAVGTIVANARHGVRYTDHTRTDLFLPNGSELHWSTRPEAALAWAAHQLANADAGAPR